MSTLLCTIASVGTGASVLLHATNPLQAKNVRTSATDSYLELGIIGPACYAHDLEMNVAKPARARSPVRIGDYNIIRVFLFYLLDVCLSMII